MDPNVLIGCANESEINAPNKTPESEVRLLQEAFTVCSCFQDRDAAGAAALHLAARFGCAEVIRWLLSVGGGAEVETNCGAVPAHYAAANGDLACLQLLVQQAPGSVHTIIHLKKAELI